MQETIRPPSSQYDSDKRHSIGLIKTGTLGRKGRINIKESKRGERERKKKSVCKRMKEKEINRDRERDTHTERQRAEIE